MKQARAVEWFIWWRMREINSIWEEKKKWKTHTQAPGVILSFGKRSLLIAPCIMEIKGDPLQ